MRPPEGKDGFFCKEKGWVCAFCEKRFFQLFFPLIVLYAGGNNHWKQLQLKKKEGIFLLSSRRIRLSYFAAINYFYFPLAPKHYFVPSILTLLMYCTPPSSLPKPSCYQRCVVLPLYTTTYADSEYDRSKRKDEINVLSIVEKTFLLFAIVEYPRYRKMPLLPTR